MADAYAELEAQQLPSSLADPTAQDMIDAASCTGRSTLFCCLSCGMPYAFPDHAYMSDDRQVREILFFVHKIRHQIRQQDNNRASTMQWQVVLGLHLDWI